MAAPPEAWQFYGIVATQFGTGFVVWMKLRRSREAIDHATKAATKAAKYAEPTGNGFAQEIREDLAELKRLVRQSYQVAAEARDEIREHKDAHIRASLRKEDS